VLGACAKKNRAVVREEFVLLCAASFERIMRAGAVARFVPSPLWAR
jgi:hypothetical protein